jgi:glycosyltransferase involved in cell wall biosynthesis
MRVLLSATNVAPGVGGGETFILGLVSGLAQAPGLRCGLVVPADPPAELAQGLPPEVELLPIGTARGATRVARDGLLLDRLVRRWHADVFHYPHEWVPRVSCPTVLTIQNVAFLHPETLALFGRRARLLRTLMKRTAHRAAAVGAVSTSAGDLWRRLTGYAGEVAVIPEGCSEGAVAESQDIDASPHCLLVTGPYPYKNTGLGIDAFRRARSSGFGWPLHVVGVDGDDEPDIRYHGWVSRPRLLHLMRLASICVFPSSVESFGLPALESLTVGTPCIFLKGTAMDEWLGRYGIPVDRSSAAVADAMLAVAQRPPGPIPPKGLEQFDWELIAAQWAQLYGRTLR